MGDRQRLVIGNLTQYGMVEEVDGMDLPANAFQLLQNLAPYKGRLGCAGRWGALSSATPIFTGTTYACCGLWDLYNSGTLKIKAGVFAEYENAAATMYEIPCWLGIYSTVVNSTGVTTGQSLDGNWTTSTFPRAPNKWLTTSDKVFLSPIATPEFAKNFTDLGGWAFTVSGVTNEPVAGDTYTNNTQTFTISYCSLVAGSGTIYTTGTGAPTAAPNTLAKATGSGDSSISFSARTDIVTLKTYSTWTDSSTAILQSDTDPDSTGPLTADTAYNATTTEGFAFNSGAIAAITNQLFTIRKIKLLAQYSRAALIVRDNTTKRGYALEVERTTESMAGYYTFTCRVDEKTPPTIGDEYTNNSQTFTITGHEYTNTGRLVVRCTGTGLPTAAPSVLERSSGFTGGLPLYHYISTNAGGPVMVTIRLWDGYFLSTNTNIGDYAAVVWEKTNITDWFDGTYNETNYEDLWMWWRDNFITFGYGPNAIGCVTTSATPTAPRIGFMLNNAYLAAASSGKSSIYSFAISAGKTGPYAVSALSSTTLTITSPPADGDYIVWGCKYASRKKIVTASDYVIFVTDNTTSANFPATIWRGGMMEEVPLTNPTYGQNWAWGANDIAIYKGRVFLGGANKLISKIGANGFYQWVSGLNQPTLVKWSCPYAPDVWEDQFPDGTALSSMLLSGNIDFSETNGAVNAIGQLRDILVVYKQDAIAMLSPTGIALDPFQVDYMAWKVGVGEPRAVGISPETHIFPMPDQLWSVTVGEVTKLPARYSVGDYGKVWMLPGENTIFAQAYFSGDTQNLCMAYNYDRNMVYYAQLKNLVDIVESKNAVFAITAAGLYLYQTRETNSIPDSYPCAAAQAGTAQFITSVISMNDMLTNKTIYTVDVFTRHRGTGAAPTSASLDIRVTVDNTAEAAYTTVAGQIIGKEQPGFALVANPINDTNLWRFRYHKILTGLTFQVDVKMNTSYLTHEIVRIEIDYESTGTSKQA